MRSTGVFLIGLLTIAAPLQAEDRAQLSLDVGDIDGLRWQQSATAQFSQDEYQRMVDNNRSVVRQELHGLANRLLADENLGIRATGMLGTVVAASLVDTRLTLNRAHSLGLLLHNAADSDRSLVLQYRQHW